MRRSSSVMNRVGSYFGVDHSESSLDLWKEKIEKAAKTKALDVSLANLLPSNSDDPDQDIKLLEDVLAQPLLDETRNNLSDHIMSHSTEEIVSVQVLQNDDDDDVVVAWRQIPGSTDSIAAKRVSVPANEECSKDEVLTDGMGNGSESGTVEMKTLQSDSGVSKEEILEERALLAVSEAASTKEKTQGRQPPPMDAQGEDPLSCSHGDNLSQEEVVHHERRPSVSFSPNVSVVEFEKSTRRLSLKKMFKMRKSKTSDADVQDNSKAEPTRPCEVIHQYNTKLEASSSSELDIVQDKDEDSHLTSQETLITSCSLHGDIFHECADKEADNRLIKDDNIDIGGYMKPKGKGILSFKGPKKVDNLEASGLDNEAFNQLALTEEGDMLTGSAALDYYEILCKAREEAIESERERGLLESLRKKEELLDAVMESAIESKKASKQSKTWFQGLKSLWSKSQHNAIQPHPTLSSHIRMQIEVLPDHKPYVTVIISITQIMVFLFLCFFGGISTVGLRPKTTYLDNVKTFRGTEMVVSVEYPNVWVGPSAAFWIRYGALFAPCLRNDHKINVMLSKQDYQASDPLGCCEVAARNTAGTTTQLKCYEYTYNVGHWLAVKCSRRPAGANNIAHILKPCCYRLTGECKLTTHQHCTFLGGYYHATGPEHCSEVNCLTDICGMGGFTMQADPESLYMPIQPNQWWRLLISPFYHNGILHLILVLIPQLLLAVPIEKMAGGVRLFLIYFVSEIIGHLLASLFTPYLPHMGSSAAVCGLIAVQTIELAQSWVLVKRPHHMILKLVTIFTIFLLSGTLPYLDNFAHLGGFIAGSLAAIIFLPYIVFGEWHSRRRRILLFLAIPSLVTILSMVLMLFYLVQVVDFCTACQYINCIPYTPYLCNSTWSNPQPSM